MTQLIWHAPALERTPLAVALVTVGIAATATLAGCSSTPAPDEPGAQVAAVRRDTELKHESCDLKSSDAVRLDANGDGRHEIVKVMRNGKVSCKAVDLNMDGVIDFFVYYDDAGQVRRREYGYDRGNRPNEIVIYKNGVVVQKMRETNNDRKIDTWDYYQNGRLVREERDSTGDGFVDQWWTFNRPNQPKCAIVVIDSDGDGKPEPESKLDICKDEGDIPPPPAPAPAATGTATAAAATPPAPATPAATGAATAAPAATTTPAATKQEAP